MKITKEILDGYLNGLDTIDKLVCEIFKYVKSNYQEYLAFGKYSRLDEWKLDENKLSIKYYDHGYDLYDYCWFFKDIPVDILLNDTWKEFIDEHFNNLMRKKEANKAASEAREKEQRQKLYEELKKEFENEK